MAEKTADCRQQSDLSPTAEHARLGASNAERWMKCPGSVRLNEGLPRKTSAYAAEGIAAHAIVLFQSTN